MGRFASAAGAAAVIAGALLSAPAAGAAAVSTIDRAPVPVPAPAGPSVQLLDCFGTTGAYGCGPGWTWRDGWRGFACYPC
jgi:hypothetical protein